MNKQLSSAQIRYLFAIRELEPGGPVRQGHIAQLLGVSDPSAHKMLQQLEKLELIAKKPYATVQITPAGQAAIRHYYDCYCLIRRFFAQAVQLSDEYASQAAIALLGELDLDGTEQLCRSIAG